VFQACRPWANDHTAHPSKKKKSIRIETNLSVGGFQSTWLRVSILLFIFPFWNTAMAMRALATCKMCIKNQCSGQICRPHNTIYIQNEIVTLIFWWSYLLYPNLHNEDVIPTAPKVSLNINQMMKQLQKSELSMPQFTLKHQTSGWTWWQEGRIWWQLPKQHRKYGARLRT
jgi:hypothetical protein